MTMANTTTTETPADTGYKYYKNNLGYYEVLPNAGNSIPGYTEISQSDFNTAEATLRAQDPGRWNPYFDQMRNNPTLKNAFTTGQSGIQMVNGTPTLTSAINEQAANKAAEAAGTIRNTGTVSTPLYVPTGSAADKLQAGVTSGSVSPTDPNAQFAASQTGNNVATTTPVAPNVQPAPSAQPAQAPQSTQTAQTAPTAPTGQGGQTQAGGLQVPTFYKPDPNSPQIVNANGDKLSYDQYIAQGGQPDFSNVKQGGPPVVVSNTANTTATPAPDTIKPLLDTHGIQPASPTDDPVKYAQDTYDKVASNLGLSALKKQTDDTNKRLLDLRNEKTEKAAEINNDPWLSEGVRVQRQRQLDSKYEQKEANLVAYLTLSQGMYQQGVQQAQFISNAAIGLYQDQVNFAQQQSLQTQQHAQAMADARFQLAQGQPFYVNEGSQTVYSTATGKPLTYDQYIKEGGDPAFANVHKIEKEGTITERAMVTNLIAQDPGAGILPTDSLAVAEQKFKSGAVYRRSTYIAPSGGSGHTVAIPGVGTLSNTQIDNINPLVTSFQNSPIVQNYNTIAEGYNFVKGLSNDTKNPADDQALIYSLAKALDPGSVVREGEYATAQKYAQSLVQSYGKSITQALQGTGFLSTDARNNIKATIESKFRAAEQSYSNISNETARRIELIGGLPAGTGAQFINNYSAPYSPNTNTSAPSQIVLQGGGTTDLSKLDFKF